MAITGGLLAAHDDFRAALLAELPADLAVRPAVGTAGDGALRLARAAAHGEPVELLESVTVHVPGG
jgi:hypothetical protein